MRLGPLTISFFLVAPFQVSAPNCALQGIVIRAATGEPLEGATLTLLHLNSSDQWRKATTGPKGRFEFDNVSQGKYEIMAEHEGLLSSWYGQRFPSDLGTNLVLQSGQKVSDIVLRLFPEAAISGRVTDEECKPVAQVTVYALGYGPLNCRRQWSSAASARTDHRGFYHLSGLQSSRYLVLADYGTSVVGFYKLKHSYAPTYYPGTSDPHNAAAIEVTAGNELPGVDFSLVLAGSVFNVEGQARYGSSPPPASMAIGLAPQRSDSEFSYVRITPSGRARMEASDSVASSRPPTCCLRTPSTRTNNIGRVPPLKFGPAMSKA